MSNRVGFTGAQFGPVTVAQLVSVTRLLREYFESGAQFHHGCNCLAKPGGEVITGWDDIAAHLARDIGYVIVGHPPTDRSKLHPDRIVNDIELSPLPYLERNHRIVDDTLRLIAAPVTHYEVVRSGTYATVRWAVRRGKPGDLVKPLGTVIPIERAVSVNRDPKLS